MSNNRNRNRRPSDRQSKAEEAELVLETLPGAQYLLPVSKMPPEVGFALIGALQNLQEAENDAQRAQALGAVLPVVRQHCLEDPEGFNAWANFDNFQDVARLLTALLVRLGKGIHTV